MATLAVTIAAGGEAGAIIRRLATVLNQAAIDIPDRNPTGSSIVLTFDNAPSSGTASVQISGGNLGTGPTYRV